MAAPREENQIGVLIADDSTLWASTLSEILDGDPDLRVVDRVGDGQQAVDTPQPRGLLQKRLVLVKGGLELARPLLVEIFFEEPTDQFLVSLVHRVLPRCHAHQPGAASASTQSAS